MSAPWLLIGPAASRRIDGLQQALRARGLPAAGVIDYADLLRAPGLLAERLARDPQVHVKLESPGEAPALHAALVERGWRRMGQPGAPPHPLEHGELAHQHFWYAGFADLLAALPADAHYLNPPGDLLAMADKYVCQQRLADAGSPVPERRGLIGGYQDLRERLRDDRGGQVFVKARYGSSGAGVLAYRRHRDGREIAIGPAELVAGAGRVRVFNSLRQRRYTDAAQIARLVDAIAAQGAYLERWVPKPAVPGARGRHYDIRVVALDGRPRQRIARSSQGPLTNLHLGNRRVALDALLDPAGMAVLDAAVAGAARAFPRSRMVGFDLILRGVRAWLLEANGFGDLLPELRWQGRTTYEDQAALYAEERLPMEPCHA